MKKQKCRDLRAIILIIVRSDRMHGHQRPASLHLDGPEAVELDGRLRAERQRRARDPLRHVKAQRCARVAAQGQRGQRPDSALDRYLVVCAFRACSRTLTSFLPSNLSPAIAVRKRSRGRAVPASQL